MRNVVGRHECGVHRISDEAGRRTQLSWSGEPWKCGSGWPRNWGDCGLHKEMEGCVASCSAAPGPVSLGALGVKHGVTEGKKCDYEGPEKANEERFLEKDHEQVFALAGVCAGAR
jgi:hypothetical protein